MKISLYKMLYQLIEYNVKNIFFSNHTKKEAGRQIPDVSLFFKKAFDLA